MTSHNVRVVKMHDTRYCHPETKVVHMAGISRPDYYDLMNGENPTTVAIEIKLPHGVVVLLHLEEDNEN